ncbi:MAG: hypothetical protein Q4C01_07675, partial [Clostridia bacterium]|nr:hypothetical protein [Clostridia bacterium]
MKRRLLWLLPVLAAAVVAAVVVLAAAAVVAEAGVMTGAVAKIQDFPLRNFNRGDPMRIYLTNV